MTYVLDACALIAFLNNEAGSDTVAELLVRAEVGADRLYMSGIQVMEVFYDRIYVKGMEYAETVLENIFNSRIIVLTEISRDIIREAGRFKTTYSMSLADTFASATAKILGSTLITKDNEMKEAEEAGEFSVQWLAK
jgi:predicted nucleic acid-binding protein